MLPFSLKAEIHCYPVHTGERNDYGELLSRVTPLLPWGNSSWDRVFFRDDSSVSWAGRFYFSLPAWAYPRDRYKSFWRVGRRGTQIFELHLVLRGLAVHSSFGYCPFLILISQSSIDQRTSSFSWYILVFFWP